MQTKITSRQNPLVVRLSKLSDKKHRDEEGLFRLDGVKLISEALMNGVLPEYVFVTDDMSASGYLKEIPEDRLYTVTDEVLAKQTRSGRENSPSLAEPSLSAAAKTSVPPRLSAVTSRTSLPTTVIFCLSAIPIDARMVFGENISAQSALR